MLKLAVLAVMALLLMGSVNAQQRGNSTDASAPITTQEEPTIVTNETESADVSPTTEENPGIITALRRELERRWAVRLKQIEERRQSIVSNLENLTGRRQEFEVRRQEQQRNSDEERIARRMENEARRAGRTPRREQRRNNQQRQQRVDQTAESDADNEVDSGALPPTVADAIRNVVLIEEASGNVRLVDLGTEEGRELASRVTVREETADDKKEVLSKLRLKLGQL
ncbi:uncharacterized protein LOC131694117 [Topomyia yanbarensis]|uniref:uncharacterized protein LOC131694117 n=1 Tax=Topomyia yanbarensis TaxID=2498891 RepID=UPI00273B7B7B|nr:uncharacterized protein LOC131694117 [Topomyia yanbarensis]